MNPFLAVPLVFAALAPIPAPEPPQVVDVGVYVMNVGKFELATGSFTIDFYLTLKSDRPIPDGAFEFMNGRAGSVDVILNEVKHKEFRVLANLYQNLDPHPRAPPGRGRRGLRDERGEVRARHGLVHHRLLPDAQERPPHPRRRLRVHERPRGLRGRDPQRGEAQGVPGAGEPLPEPCSPPPSPPRSWTSGST